MSARLLLQAVRVLAASGVLDPPWHLPALVRARRETGMSPASLVAIAAAQRPDNLAVIDERGTMTYSQLDDQAARVASGLRTRVGDVHSVAVLCRNHRGFLLATAAAGRLGADVVFLNTEFSAPQLAGVLQRMRPSVVVADKEFPLDAPAVDVHELTDFPRHRTDQPVRAGKVTILTSGTTGAPKGAPRAANPFVMLPPTVATLRRSRLRAAEPVMIGVPLFHGFGFATWCLAALLRAPVVLHRRFDPETALASMAAHRVAAFAGVPVMLQRLLAAPHDAYDLTALHTVISGGAPLRPELAARFQDVFGDVLLNGYGSSEVGIAAIASAADLRAAPGTVGRPCEGTPIRVLDKAGQVVRTGEQGVIHVGGPGLVSGKEMSTGDIGHFDADGRLYVDGRADDMIVSGGENVYPGEVEDALARHPAIADAAVIGVDDAEYGQRLVAYLVARDAPPTAEDLATYVKSTLARYKVPREFVFLDQLPRNATGKVLRRQLEQKGSASHHREAEPLSP
ncbi:AMP-binding protein [Fodinicola acaciae]|uniref:AMP-binding protein n=1 Tax=Fodinicola acaciae TaxID=2681555 RepID=UPI0013D06627|nr:AMP-binding protein [Fodinicola acaciae]